MFDNELLFRAASAGNLTADMAVVYLNLGAPTDGKLVVRIVVPVMATAGDTIVPTVHLSVDGVGNGERQIVAETITKVGVDAGNHEYYISVPKSPYPYIGLALDITGATFNAGVVVAGLVPAGEYDKV